MLSTEVLALTSTKSRKLCLLLAYKDLGVRGDVCPSTLFALIITSGGRLKWI